MKLKLTRRRFIQVLGGVAAGVAIGGPLYAFRFEPYSGCLKSVVRGF